MREIAVAEGDYVSAGTVLARLDSRLAASQLADVDSRLGRAAERLRATDAALALVGADTAGAPINIDLLPEPTRSYMRALITTMSLARQALDAAEFAARVQRALSARGFTTPVADRAAQDRVNRAALQLQTVRANGERDLVAQAATLRDDVERLTAERGRAVLSSENAVMRAPISGSVTGLTIQRTGQVVREGQTLLRISPDGARLVLDATIRPAQRGGVLVGQPVVVRFDAFDAQRFGVARGRIANISPDVEFNQTGAPIGYHMLIRFDGEQFSQALPRGRQIEPGMTASIQVISDRARALDLLFRQLRGSTQGGEPAQSTDVPGSRID